MRRKVYYEFGREIGTLEDHDTRDPDKAHVGCLIVIGLLIVGAIIFL